MKPGTVIAERYVIDTLAGSGGMGAIYKAHDRSGRSVALKILEPRSREMGLRFTREAALLRQLSHPTIVRYLDSGVTATGEQFLAMEWLEGCDLKQRLTGARLTASEALHVVGRVATALSVAHNHGIVHRDVKPANIFLPDCQLNAAKLLDFGLARWAHGSNGITVAGTRFGTPAYMSPEQVRGETELSARCDIFSLGCVLFECLTGEPAFAAHDPMAVFCKILMARVPEPSTLSAAVPAEVDDLVRVMLAKNPAERLATGSEAARRVRTIAAALPEAEHEVRPRAPTHHALTTQEQRWVNVVVAAVDTRSGPAAPPPLTNSALEPLLSTRMYVADPEEHRIVLDQLFARMESLGAQCGSLGDGALVAVLESPEVATMGTVIDQTANAARCALIIHELFPDSAVGLASGRATIGQQRLIDDVIDHAVSLLAAPPGHPGGERTLDGTIRVDGTTGRLLGSRFELSAQPDGHRLLVGEHSFDAPQVVLGRTTPFVGRKRALSTLLGTIEECLDESLARLALVTGPAGYGKSRLRHELLGRLGQLAEGAQVWMAHGDPMRAGSPMALLSEAIRRACGIDERWDQARQRDALERRVTHHLTPDSAHRVTMFLAELLEISRSSEEDVQLRAARRDPLLMADQVRRACLDLLTAETAAHPLIMIIEDLHWGDRTSLAVLDVAMRDLSERPLAVIGFGRPEVHDTFSTLWTTHDCTTVHLGRLSRQASHTLARAILGDEVDEQRIAALVAQADGNAFYLEELARSAATGQWTLPDTVLAMVDTRLGSLVPTARQVLRAASVFGPRFWRDGIAHMIDGDIAIDQWLDELVAAEFVLRVDRSRFAGHDEYTFRHSLLRDGAYAMLTDEDRQLGHRLAGAWLEEVGENDSQVLAEHFERGQQPERALPHLRHAAEDALRRSDLNAAVALAERGIEHGAARAMLGAFKWILIEERIWQGKTTEVAELCCEAMALLDAGSRAWYAVFGEAVMAAGRLGRDQRIEELAGMLPRTPDPSRDRSGWQIAAAKLALQLFGLGQVERAQALVAELENQLGDLTRAPPFVAAHLHFTRAVSADARQDPGRMLTELQQCAAQFTEIGDLRQAVLQRNNVGHAKIELGLFAEAEAELRSVISDAEHLTLDLAVHAASQSLGVVLARGGAYGDACAHLRAAVAGFGAQGDVRMKAWSRLDLADTLLAIGDPD
ncbi:MAG: protein kinase, partial [Myxococcota bacterium]